MADNTGTTTDRRRFAPATQRNRQPILAALEPRLREARRLLEIASGSGEHAVWLAARMPHLTWLPSDPTAPARASIADWIVATGVENVRPPRDLDAQADAWPLADDEVPLDAVLACNLLHIAPWTVALGLFAGAGRYLRPGGRLFIYGPFIRPEIETAPSNLAFDAELRRQNADWGVRALPDVQDAALERNLLLDEVLEMPANNLVLVFRKKD